jgi:hypothetical protein
MMMAEEKFWTKSYDPGLTASGLSMARERPGGCPPPQRIPQYIEVPPNIKARRIISYFSAVLSY